MPQRDINCRSFSVYLKLMRERGIAVDGICDGLNITLEEALDPGTWLDWPTACVFMQRLEDHIGGPLAVADFSYDATAELNASFYAPLFRLVVTPYQLYRLAAKVVAPGNCPYHNAQIVREDEQTLHVVLSIPDTGPGSETFFRTADGFFRALPTILNLEPAGVTSTISPHRGEYKIKVGQHLSMWTRIRRMLSPRSRAAAIEELESQQRQLSENNRELQRAYDEIKAREQRLTEELDDRARMQEAYELQEEQLRQSQKMEAMGKLSGGMAHDFNNHLTVILLYAEATLEATDLDSAKHYADKIRDAALTSASLTKQLLAFARKQMLKPKVLNLNDLVAKTDDMLRRTLGERVDLDFVRGAGLGKVRVDPAQLEQALVNLVINARDAIGDGTGYLTVETANVYLDRSYAETHGDVQPGRYVMLAISDDGPGIPEDEMKLVFEPFFTTKETGTGLGLSMVQGFVSQSGGLINVYSEPGVGTSFKIYLPRVDQEHPPDGWDEAPVTDSVRGSESILVIEDEELLCDLVTQMLTHHGYKVMSAKDGMEAVRIAEGKHLDLVLTDVVMPGMNGPEVAAKLRESHPDMVTVYMSGYTENAIVHRGELDAGVVLIEKPFTTRELLSVVRKTLSRHNA